MIDAGWDKVEVLLAFLKDNVVVSVWLSLEEVLIGLSSVPFAHRLSWEKVSINLLHYTVLSLVLTETCFSASERYNTQLHSYASTLRGHLEKGKRSRLMRYLELYKVVFA